MDKIARCRSLDRAVSNICALLYIRRWLISVTFRQCVYCNGSCSLPVVYCMYLNVLLQLPRVAAAVGRGLPALEEILDT